MGPQLPRIPGKSCLKQPLKFKLIVLGVILSVAPLGVVALSTFYQNRRMTDAAADGLSPLAHESLPHAVAGIRTIATDIPAVNPDGSANSVVASLPSRKTFYGRAYLVNAGYLAAAYEPLFNTDGKIIGAP